MNTANLQMEGLLLAVASVLEVMVRREVVTREELSQALEAAEQCAARDREGLRQANLEAIRFPIRYLMETVGGAEGNGNFAAVATRVAEALDERREDD